MSFKQNLIKNDNSTMEEEFTSKIGCLAEKEFAEDILKGIIPQTLQGDIETKEFLDVLALSEIKDIYHQK